MKLGYHWTAEGRVVYSRKKHLFTEKDIARIQKRVFAIKIDGPDDSVRDWFEKYLTQMSLEVLGTMCIVFDTNSDVEFLRQDIFDTIHSWVGATVYTQREKPGDAIAWRILVI